MKIKKLRITAALIAAAALMAAAGCGETGSSSNTGSNETTTATTAETTEENTTVSEAEEELGVIGEKKDGDSVCAVALSNKTGKDIKEFSVKSDSEEDYPGNMIPDGETFGKNEDRILYFETSANEEYSIKLVFDDGSESELHSFPFGDIDEGSIRLDSDVAYLVYTSESEKSEVNTKNDELKAAGKEVGHVVEDNFPEATEPTTNAPVDVVPTDPVVTAPPATNPPATEPPVVTDPIVTEPPATEPPATTADPNGGCIGDGGLFY